MRQRRCLLFCDIPHEVVGSGSEDTHIVLAVGPLAAVLGPGFSSVGLGLGLRIPESCRADTTGAVATDQVAVLL